MSDWFQYMYLLHRNTEATFGYAWAARAVYSIMYGDTKQEMLELEDARYATIAQDLLLRYGENLSVNDVRKEMTKGHATGLFK